MDWLLEEIRKEWPVIKEAPLFFSIAVALASCVIGLVIYQYFRTNLEMKSDLLASKNELITSLETKITSLPVSPGKTEEITHNIALFLQFSDGHTVPKEIRQSNVLSWYALYTESIYVDAKDKKNKSVGGFSVPPRWNIFVLFKQPVQYRQMFAVSTGSESLKSAVAFSNDRYAIVTVVGDVSRATLEVSVQQ